MVPVGRAGKGMVAGTYLCGAEEFAIGTHVQPQHARAVAALPAAAPPGTQVPEHGRIEALLVEVGNRP